jgi:hypothetical protein
MTQVLGIHAFDFITCPTWPGPKLGRTYDQTMLQVEKALPIILGAAPDMLMTFENNSCCCCCRSGIANIYNPLQPAVHFLCTPSKQKSLSSFAQWSMSTRDTGRGRGNRAWCDKWWNKWQIPFLRRQCNGGGHRREGHCVDWNSC